MTQTQPNVSQPQPADQEKPARPEAATEGAGARAGGEKGGPKGPEPTRYGDWERNGRCIDF